MILSSLVPLSPSLHILVCDDERHLVRLIEVNLRRQGHTIACAYGGREVISRLEKEDFDLLVLDLEMPDVDGHAVLRWVRANERTKDLRVVLLKDKGPRDDPPGGPPGADLYLTKPFNPARLLG